ncbi:cytochrome P450 [Aspergillus campestris IBT 28561]|uniref:Cytochrome P450 n=1 Tax=Aspergillus campestris (strain IBT 28561) TaxID=1392248 RepID=A0A2I1D4E7_ASPC2|nr:cytochrome P450 [Aspergillus campestris IBT 28561]PKY04740.1 cytochrome P450 [Aspergillus campestris IBT 28561]
MLTEPEHLPWLVLYFVAGAIVLQKVFTVAYRLFFHPLAKVPGPLLAHATYLYSFWHNLNGARFYLQIEKLHQQYGPIVRITPNEVHLSDPTSCDKIYFVGSPYGKSALFYGAFGTTHATFTTPSPEVHRVKRAALNPFFSRKNVFALEDIVHQKAHKLVARMQKAFATGGAIDLHYGFRAISVDEKFGVSFFKMVKDFGPAIWFFQQFPSVQPFALATPLWLANLMSGPLTRMMMHQEGSRHHILQVKDAVDRGEKPQRTTIFHQLLSPNAAEGHVVPTVDQLKDEAFVIVAAAADTTGNALTISTYNVVRNPDIYAKLTAELKEAFPDPEARLDFVTLEKLPYLTGVIKEGLRLSFGVVGRLPRVVPDTGAEFHGYHVPQGTTVSMSSWIMHHNEELFPDAEKFDPTRWTDPEQFKTMERYLFSFGKGSRQCVGMPLAYCELYVTLGRVFRQFDNLKTPGKSREEMLYDDYFSSYHPEKYNQFLFTSND